MGTISYEGRVVNTERMKLELGKARSGNTVMKLTVAEQHRTKNKNAPREFQKADKTPEDWVDTTTSWHRLTIIGEKAEDLAVDEDFGHGAIVVVTDATYTEEAPWTDRAGVQRAGRPETVFSTPDGGTVTIKEWNGRVFGQREPKALWDGETPLKDLERGNGGGAAPEFTVKDDEGF